MQAALGQRTVVVASARVREPLHAGAARAVAIAAVIVADCALMLLPPVVGVLILAGAIR